MAGSHGRRSAGSVIQRVMKKAPPVTGLPTIRKRWKKAVAVPEPEPAKPLTRRQKRKLRRTWPRIVKGKGTAL